MAINNQDGVVGTLLAVGVLAVAGVVARRGSRGWGEGEDVTVDLNVPETVLHTDGKGLWSCTIKSVRITGATVVHPESADYGNLKVYFDTESWDPKEDGLIYTDDTFLVELRTLLKERGYNVGLDEIIYSQQGLQGNDYVDFDVDEAFIASI